MLINSINLLSFIINDDICRYVFLFTDRVLRERCGLNINQYLNTFPPANTSCEASSKVTF